MDRKTALAAAATVTMTVVGGVSALFLTVGSGAGAATIGAEANQPEVTVEYVDQNGNPVADPTAVTLETTVEATDEVANVEATYADEADGHEGGEAYEPDHEEGDDYEDGDHEGDDEEYEHEEGDDDEADEHAGGDDVD